MTLVLHDCGRSHERASHLIMDVPPFSVTSPLSL